MPRLSPSVGGSSDMAKQEFTSEPFDFEIETGNEAVHADVYAIIYTAPPVTSNDLTVKINGSEASLKNATDDGLYIFEVNQPSIKPGINVFSIKGRDGSGVLKDAALFFCRDKDDFEMRNLISLCR